MAGVFVDSVSLSQAQADYTAFDGLVEQKAAGDMRETHENAKYEAVMQVRGVVFNPAIELAFYCYLAIYTKIVKTRQTGR